MDDRCLRSRPQRCRRHDIEDERRAALLAEADA
jgi:hypothetical protein